MRIQTIACVSLLASVAAASTGHFHQWFRQYGPTFEIYRNGPCKHVIDDYHRGYSEPPCNYRGCLSGRVVHCLQSAASESSKANMAAAAVVLGLLPTTLSLIGSNTMETGVLALRRPILAAILASGSPSVAPMRMFAYDDPVELLRRTPTVLSVPDFPTANIVVPLAEYLLGIAAVANLCHLSYVLGVRAVCSFSSETEFHPALWAVLALAIHIWGSFSVRLRLGLRRQPAPSARPTTSQGWRRIARDIFEEFHTFGCQGSSISLNIREKATSNLFVFLTWLTSMATVGHIIYGTIVFSSILFVSTYDAVQLVARYLGSTIVCRSILVLELGGIRKSLIAVHKESADVPLLRMSPKAEDITRTTEV